MGIALITAGVAAGIYLLLEYYEYKSDELREEIYEDNYKEEGDFRDTDGDGNWDEGTIDLDDQQSREVEKNNDNEDREFSEASEEFGNSTSDERNVHNINEDDSESNQGHDGHRDSEDDSDWIA